ncbi:MAG TPA: CPBP family intramembrane glutamic endopeptidase [Polyangiaceae bacterium]|nr:CPBP family intramembrane glutamic endopeptidase [Polyangiaceae bacterium]
MRAPFGALLGLLAALTLSFGLAFSPRFADSWTFWLLIAVPLALAAGWSALELARLGRLRALLLPRGGDVLMGVVTAFALLAATWLGRTRFAALGTPRQEWLFSLYLQLGDPNRLEGSLLLSATLVVVAVSQELIYRGYAQEALSAEFGPRRGFALSAAAYSLTVFPTLFTLATPHAGPNPLLFLSALLGGVVLGSLRRFTERLPPVIVAQIVFCYFSVLQFRLPGL